MSDSNKGTELTVFLDTIPNLIRLKQTQPAKNLLKQRFQEGLAQRIDRWGQLPHQLVQIKYFESFINNIVLIGIEPMKLSGKITEPIKKSANKLLKIIKNHELEKIKKLQ